jgi:molybdate transport repressor ModE-like protein
MHHRSHRLVAQHKVWLERGDRFVLGDGGIALFRAIDGTGSVRGAAREVGWSYRHALAYLDHAERALGYRIVARARGGNERGGAALTGRGRELVQRYGTFRARLERAFQRLCRSALADGRR